MRILIGTGNPAKVARYADILRALPGVTVVAPGEVPPLPPVAEDGANAEENARRKARAYAEATGLPTLSVDDALYFPALPPEAQPGTQVRRYGGAAATDDELLRRFLALIGPLAPHQRRAVWHYAVCVALPGGPAFVDRGAAETVFTDRPRFPLAPGYPLSAIQVDPATGKALPDLSPAEQAARLQSVAEAVRRVVHGAVAAATQSASP